MAKEEEPAAATGRSSRLRLATSGSSPLAAIWQRIVAAGGLMVVVVAAVWLDRDGYRDPADGEMSLLDAAYYATVTLSTTGYGDIVPVTDAARLVNILLVTPARVLFLIILVGTTLEVLTERSREQLRAARWRRTVKDHIVVCGYGTKGRSAIRTLRNQGIEPEEIVVVDSSQDAVDEAGAARLTAVHGSSTRTDVLRDAQVPRARSVVVAVDRDDTAVLTTLTVRQLAPEATITAAVREAENAHLLRQSGADSVITSSEAAGRLMGISTQSSRVVDVVQDLLVAGEGLDLVEREVGPDEVGYRGRVDSASEQIIAVVRDGRLLRFGDQDATLLKFGDHIICMRSHGKNGKKD